MFNVNSDKYLFQFVLFTDAKIRSDITVYRSLPDTRIFNNCVSVWREIYYNPLSTIYYSRILFSVLVCICMKRTLNRRFIVNCLDFIFLNLLRNRHAWSVRQILVVLILSLLLVLVYPALKEDFDWSFFFT